MVRSTLRQHDHLTSPVFGTFIYFSDPEDVRRIFRGDPDVFRAGEANASILTTALGSNSVLVTDGARHARQRRLAAPPFHGSAVRKLTVDMAAIAADDIATWPVGEPVRLLDHMRTITLEVILHAVLVATDERRRSALRSVLPPVVQNGAWTRVYPKSGFDCSGSYLNVPLSEIHQ